jgi:hypothetical protein
MTKRHYSFDCGNDLTLQYEVENFVGDVTIYHKVSGLKLSFPSAPLEIEVDDDEKTVTFFKPRVSSITMKFTRERCAHAADAMGLPDQYFFAALAGKFIPL